MQFKVENNNDSRDDQKIVEEGKIYAILSYIPFLCFIPMFKTDVNEYAKKHVKQGLLLLIVEISALFFLIEFISRIFWTLVLIICQFSLL